MSEKEMKQFEHLQIDLLEGVLMNVEEEKVEQKAPKDLKAEVQLVALLEFVQGLLQQFESGRLNSVFEGVQEQFPRKHQQTLEDALIQKIVSRHVDPEGFESRQNVLGLSFEQIVA